MTSPDGSVGVQSRISAFEALAASKPNPTAMKSAPSLLDTPVSPSSKNYFPIAPSSTAGSTKFPSRSPSASPPPLGRKTSLVDLKDWVVEDGPLPYAPRQRKVPWSKPALNGVTIIHRTNSESTYRAATAQPTPLIHLESSPPRTLRSAPPLPPRKASYSSLQSVSIASSSSSSLARSPHAQASVLPPTQNRKKSDSLTVDHTYPPLAKLGIAIPSRTGNGSGHVPASSVSSFHSVSLSSDGGTDLTTPGSLTNFVATYPVDREDRDQDHNRDADTGSLDESFENVSTSSMISPSISSVSTDWAELVRRPDPPKLPQRPQNGSSSSLPSSSSTTTISVPYAVRPQTKMPPPPPPPRNRVPSSNRSSLTSTTASSSDHSSVMSNATSRSSLSGGRPTMKYPILAAQSAQLGRPPPIPPSARRRYETVFNKNVIAQRKMAKDKERALSPPPGRKTRQAAGWRGLSVDLITSPELQARPDVDDVEEDVNADERLNGRIVAMIWKTSKLERAKLKSIWYVS